MLDLVAVFMLAPVAEPTLARVAGHTKALAVVPMRGRVAEHMPVPVVVLTLGPGAVHMLDREAEHIPVLAAGLTRVREGLVILAREVAILIDGIVRLLIASNWCVQCQQLMRVRSRISGL